MIETVDSLIKHNVKEAVDNYYVYDDYDKISV